MEEIRNAFVYLVANTERRTLFGKIWRASKILKRIFSKQCGKVKT
jgi:hypothetical protein